MQIQYQTPPIEIWPHEVPGGGKPKSPAEINPENGHIIQVSNPTMERFLPKAEKDLHQSIIVCPGGAYQKLAYRHEGVEVAQWLAGLGYTAYVLAYRIPDQREGALQDIFRAIRLARSMGAEKVGILGFSAGGHLCCGAATRWAETLYPATDTADTLSPRPDFALLIYPAYLDEGPGRTLSPELTVSPHTPPLFVFGTQDDKKYSSTSCINILKAMQEHDAPIEMHYLPRGGHGYGMQGDGAGKIWPVLAKRWLEETR